MAIQLIFPVSGPFTQMFGENPQFYAKWGYAGHNGVDFGIPNGTPVKAAADGTVDKVSFEDGGYGKFIRIRHNDGSTTYYSYYAHLLNTEVNPSQKVTAGTLIAHSNNTGASTGPHLHFGVKIPGTNPSYKDYVDPMQYLGKGTGQSKEKGEPTEPGVFSGVVDIPSLKFEVTNDTLNVRSGPGVQYPIVEQLSKGDGFVGKRLHSDGVWIEIEPGKWCALSFQGTAYLKVNK